MNRRVCLSLTSLMFFALFAYPQAVPTIEDVVGRDDIRESVPVGEDGDGSLRLIGTFKIYNPDTVPFYIWISFDNGGKFKHYKYADAPTVRLIDLELRYKNALEQPMVKMFPNNRFERRGKKRFGGAWLMGSGARSGKRGSRGSAAAEEVEVEPNADVEEAAGRRGRGNGASEIAFWKEDAQGYYEMELWGALYAPDVKKAVVAGNYAENINFEIEAMK